MSDGGYPADYSTGETYPAERRKWYQVKWEVDHEPSSFAPGKWSNKGTSAPPND
jgi:hypothetical protein